MPRRKLKTDAAVLQEAMRVIFAHGPGQFTLAHVSEAVGIAPATLVQRFGDKRGLVVAALAEDNKRFARELDAAPRAVGPEAVIDLFWGLTPGENDDHALADQLLWLRQDAADPQMGALAQARFALLREALAARMPPLPIPSETAARLVEAQWQGALVQWAVERRGPLADYVAESLTALFDLAAGPPPEAA
jgi:AcrR family transcriptional regulator